MGRRFRFAIQLLVIAGGIAALSWEVLWQLKASLAFGASASGTALTLAMTMGGMTLGSLLMGAWLSRPSRALESISAVRLYGFLELAIGISGLVMPYGFSLLEWLDVRVYAITPALATTLHGLGISFVLGPATMAMGATIPVFQLVARSSGVSLSVLYGLNTAGAALGVLFFSFVLLPALGVSQTISLVALLNFAVFGAAYALGRDELAAPDPKASSGVVDSRVEIPRSGHRRHDALDYALAQIIVFGTGFATFGLEVAWFRSLRAAFWNTSGTFAIILASVLIPLAIGARLVPWLRRRSIPPGWLLAGAGVCVLLSTPVVERMDLLKDIGGTGGDYHVALLIWLGLSLAAVGPAMLLLGMALPWCLDEFSLPRMSARLYALNTVGAVFGSLVAAWGLLPFLGFARVAWLLGIVVLGLGIAALSRGRWLASTAGATALVIAVSFASSPGRDRLQERPGNLLGRVLALYEGPDSTVSVIEDLDGDRRLMIDGFVAAGDQPLSQYMQWMGLLPVLLHPDPKSGLVICFGTGQTANSVRSEGIDSLDIVDLNEAVFRMAPLFEVNEGVLDDSRSRPMVMDGRAWLRRGDRRYDLVTLEPMPPNFAGVNALYSLEFYQMVAGRLNEGGIAAQWLPFHLVEAEHAVAIAATFAQVFHDSILWVDPFGGTGILLGRTEAVGGPLGTEWPGLERRRERSLRDEEVRRSVRLLGPTFPRYAALGRIITDDNQLLSFSGLRNGLGGKRGRRVLEDNRAVLNSVAMRPAYMLGEENATRRAFEWRERHKSGAPGNSR